MECCDKTFASPFVFVPQNFKENRERLRMADEENKGTGIKEHQYKYVRLN